MLTEIKIGGKVCDDVSENEAKPSYYQFSDYRRRENEILKLLEKEHMGKYVLGIKYTGYNDIQVGISETAKRDESPLDVAVRGLAEETNIILANEYFSKFGGTCFRSQTRKSTQSFIVDLTNPKTERSVVSRQISFSQKNDDKRMCKAHITVIGTRDQFIKLLANARPNDNISGYVLLPIGSYLLRRLMEEISTIEVDQESLKMTLDEWKATKKSITTSIEKKVERCVEEVEKKVERCVEEVEKKVERCVEEVEKKVERCVEEERCKDVVNVLQYENISEWRTTDRKKKDTKGYKPKCTHCNNLGVSIEPPHSVRYCPLILENVCKRCKQKGHLPSICNSKNK